MYRARRWASPGVTTEVGEAVTPRKGWRCRDGVVQAVTSALTAAGAG